MQVNRFGLIITLTYPVIVIILLPGFEASENSPAGAYGYLHSILRNE